MRINIVLLPELNKENLLKHKICDKMIVLNED